MVFCPYPLELRKWAEVHCNQNQAHLHLFQLREPEQSRFPVLRIRKALNGLIWWHFAAKAIQTAQSKTGYHPDLVFFPWLDSYLGNYQSHNIIDMLFPYNWSGLYFHPSHLRLPQRYSNVVGGAHDYDESLRSKRCKCVAILDEGIASILQEKLPGKRVVIFPDVTDTSFPDHNFPTLHKVIAKSGGRKIITVIGGLAKRKGMLTLLETSRTVEAKNWFFLFAGLLTENTFNDNELKFIHTVASNPPENCYFNFDFIPEENQFNALVELSDILFASYEGFPHSSNILTKAALFEKPVIVSRGYCMAERVKTFDMGESIEFENVSQCIEAIKRLLETKKLNSDFAGYRYLHSEERLRIAFQDVCTRYFGHSSPAD